MKRFLQFTACFFAAIAGCEVEEPSWEDLTGFRLRGTNNPSKVFKLSDESVEKLILSTRTTNVSTPDGGARASVNYRGTFKNSSELQYSGTLCFFKDKVILIINYPGDYGFPGDPCLGFNLGEILSENEIENLKDVYLKPGTVLLKWKSRDELLAELKKKKEEGGLGGEDEQ